MYQLIIVYIYRLLIIGTSLKSVLVIKGYENHIRGYNERMEMYDKLQCVKF